MSSNDIDVIGERFVFEHYPQLFSRLEIMKCRWNTVDPNLPKTEGADLEAWTYPENWPEHGFMERKIDFTKIRIIKGPIEVKTSNFNQYLAFYNEWYKQRIDVTCGMLPFPIWNSFKDEPPRYRLGSLYRMFYPEDNEHDRQPLAYVAVFLDLAKRPYAALVFEDYLALKYRLIEIGKKQGLDLTKEGLDRIPCENDLKGWKSTKDWMKKMMAGNRELLLMGQMWYVKMSYVIDLARVVLIGEPPERKDIFGEFPCSKEIQEARWNYLQEHKSGEPISLDVDAQTQERINEGNKLFEDLMSLPDFFPLFQWSVDRTTGNTEKRLLFLNDQE